MYQHIVTADTYCHDGERKHTWQLSCALLLALVLHILLLTGLANPIEKQDRKVTTQKNGRETAHQAT